MKEPSAPVRCRQVWLISPDLPKQAGGDVAKDGKALAGWRGHTLASCALSLALSEPRSKRDLSQFADAIMTHLVSNRWRHARMFRTHVLAEDARLEGRRFPPPEPGSEGKPMAMSAAVGEVLGYYEGCPPGFDVDTLLTPHPHKRTKPQVNTSLREWTRRTQRRQWTVAEAVVQYGAMMPGFATDVARALGEDSMEGWAEMFAPDPQGDFVERFVARWT